MKVRSNTTTTVTTTNEYTLHKNVSLFEVISNGETVSRELIFTKNEEFQKKKPGYYLTPIYDPDLERLKVTNPFWAYDRELDSKWFEGSKLPSDPKNIDVSKIIFACGYNHSYWTINLQPIPTVIRGDYIDASIRSGRYDLKKLHEYLSKHPQVISITDIEFIPYYNNEYGDEQYFEVVVLPTVEQMKKLESSSLRKNDIFYKPWKKWDALGMKPFYVESKDD